MGVLRGPSYASPNAKRKHWLRTREIVPWVTVPATVPDDLVQFNLGSTQKERNDSY